MLEHKCVTSSYPVDVIFLNSLPVYRIFTGHVDGSICLISHNGLLRKTDRTHTEAISTLRCHGDCVVAGSMDSIISVLRSIDLMPVSTLHAHYGKIRDILCVHVSDFTSNWFAPKVYKIRIIIYYSK